MKCIRKHHPTAVVATTSNDSHSWNLTGVQLQLEDRDFNVVNLGPCTPEHELACYVRDHRPDIVVISTINGHGSSALPRVIEELDRYQVRRQAKILVGGLLTTDPSLSDTVAKELKDLGVDRVFTGPQAWEDFDQYINRELDMPMRAELHAMPAHH